MAKCPNEPLRNPTASEIEQGKCRVLHIPGQCWEDGHFGQGNLLASGITYHPAQSRRPRTRSSVDEHPISLEKAKELLAGDLGDVYRRILADCCVPIYWFKLGTRDFSISHNGTLTIVQTPKILLGVTAAHVFRQYECDRKNGSLRLQLMNEVVDNLCDRLVDVSDKLDIATFALDADLVKRLGKTPLARLSRFGGYEDPKRLI